MEEPRENVPSEPTMTYNFGSDPSISAFTVPSKEYLTTSPSSAFGYMATGAVVISSGAAGRAPCVLLIQRAAHDSYPNCWEIPGGAVDDEDASILHAVARELREETGLVASHIGPIVEADPSLFVSRSGRKIGKFIFFVTVGQPGQIEDLEVRLDPNEHQKYVWATEAEVKAKKVGGMSLEFTTTDMERTVLHALSHFQKPAPIQ